MDNWMFLVGVIAQWFKANPKIPNIVVVLSVIAIGYVGYWIFNDDTLASGFHGFLKDGFEWAMRGVFALQATSVVASTASRFDLPTKVCDALPVTQGK